MKLGMLSLGTGVPLINELKRQIEMLESRLHELTQADIGSNITRVPPRAQTRRVDFLMAQRT
jgi:hypothetical protein